MIYSEPTIEQRRYWKERKGKLIEYERFYVVGVPEFEEAQKYGFKTLDNLRRCYCWWSHQVVMKGRSAKEAHKAWINGERAEFYQNLTQLEK